MIIVMNSTATKENIDNVINKLHQLDLQGHLSQGEETTIIGVVGDKSKLPDNFSLLEGILKLVPISESYKLVNSKFKQGSSIIKVGDLEIGGKEIVIMAGPCAIESEEQMLSLAHSVKKSGAQILRGGAYKPRTSPYAFQGLEVEGLRYMKMAREATGLKIITEVTSLKAVEAAVDYVDILQIGARNMQNFELLKEVGKTNTPVMLKRGLSATIDEWLNAAEYIMSEGNENVILCERGIRTFETATRNTLDISAVPALKSKTHLPVIVDPSHATGVRAYVAPLAKAAIMAGCDGLMIEVHPDPANALSDGPQSLNPEDFQKLSDELIPVAQVAGRSFKGK